MDSVELGESRRVVTSSLEFEVFTAGDPESDRLALLLHGFPEHAYSWRHQMPVFAAHGHWCWAPNLRGYGGSDRPRATRDYRIDLLLEDVRALIEASGCSRVTLVGHDWGGVLAWSTALRRTAKVDRLVIMNLPHPRLFLRAAEGSWRQRLRSWYMLFFQLPWLPERMLTAFGARAVGEAFRGMAVDKSRFPDEVLDFYRQQALQPGAARAMVNWYRGMRLSPDYRNEVRDYPKLDIPTLMIWGERDDALGVELTYGTDALVSDLTLRYLPDVSHWVQQEAPEAVNEMLDAWLRGDDVPGADRPSSGPAIGG